MDGNGRWARNRHLPRVAGHKRGVEFLTLFAFSSENWRRPADEVSILMELFLRALEQEVAKLHDNDIRFRVVGDRTRFAPRIRELMADAESLTAANGRLTLTVAANYGGRWDVMQAARAYYAAHPAALEPGTVPDPDALTPYLSMSYAPEPDLFIRTGGEQRVSNFLLWQLAYAELVFVDTLWPDFGDEDLRTALEQYARRRRRFGGR